MRRFVVLVCLIFSTQLWAAEPESMSLHALFRDKAILMIDGVRRVLVRDEVSPEGIKLLSTDTSKEQAEIEINGRREILKLGVVIASFKSTGRSKVTLWAEQGGHYHADGAINGVAVRFLVDTGATTIALNSREATRIGLDYKTLGRAGLANTAGGIVRIYTLKLNTVQLGAIKLYNIDAGVIEGSYPTEILLGMSFLGQLEIRHNGEQMDLTPRF